MTTTPSFSGYWAPIIDEQSARNAVKMAGLPLLVLALNAAVFAIALMLHANASVWPIAAFGVLTFVFLAMAFQLRSGRAAISPLAAAAYAAFLALLMWSTTRDVGAESELPIQFSIVLRNLFVPILTAVFAWRGVLGWRWLLVHRLLSTRST